MLSDPSTFGAGGETRLESRIKKVKPPFYFTGEISTALIFASASISTGGVCITHDNIARLRVFKIAPNIVI